MGTLGKIVTAQGSAKAFISLVLDQGLFAPAFLCVFLSSLFTIEGKASEIVPKLKQDFAPTVMANWNIWIPFQFLNFRFVPLNLQVAAANVVALLWNTYLSWASHKEVVVETASKGNESKKEFWWRLVVFNTIYTTSKRTDEIKSSPPNTKTPSPRCSRNNGCPRRCASRPSRRTSRDRKLSSSHRAPACRVVG